MVGIELLAPMWQRCISVVLIVLLATRTHASCSNGQWSPGTTDGIAVAIQNELSTELVYNSLGQLNATNAQGLLDEQWNVIVLFGEYVNIISTNLPYYYLQGHSNATVTANANNATDARWSISVAVTFGHNTLYAITSAYNSRLTLVSGSSPFLSGPGSSPYFLSGNAFMSFCLPVCIDPATGVSCNNGGVCLSTGCSCQLNRVGFYCETVVAVCSLDSSDSPDEVCNNGRCTNFLFEGSGQEEVVPAYCECLHTWGGILCEYPLDCIGPGSEVSCNNVGTCNQFPEVLLGIVAEAEEYLPLYGDAYSTCTCNDGWYGEWDFCVFAVCESDCDTSIVPPCYSPDGVLCSSHGTCPVIYSPCDGTTCEASPGTACQCDSGWGGTLCAQNSECNNGTYIENQGCKCNDGYGGTQCQITCPLGLTGLNCITSACANVTCFNDGVCQGAGVCNCTANYGGESCEIFKTCRSSDTSICGGRGVCENSNTCVCDYGYGGDMTCDSQLEGTTCYAPDGILCGGDSNHGFCDGGTLACSLQDLASCCNCDAAWTGTFCTVPSFCLNGGVVSGGVCVCPSNFFGTNCQLAHCQNGGSLNGSVCTCAAGWQGSNCSISIPSCVEGFMGTNCATRTCLNPITGVSCSGAGVCSSGICRCDTLVIGPTCRTLRGGNFPVVGCDSTHALALNCTSGFTNSTLVNSPFTGLTSLVDCANTSCECTSSVAPLDAYCFVVTTTGGRCNGHGTRTASNNNGAACACEGYATENECGSAVFESTICSDVGICTCGSAYTPQYLCPEGLTGSFCSIASCINPITGESCSNAGVCVSGVCACVPTRYGPTCRLDASPGNSPACPVCSSTIDRRFGVDSCSTADKNCFGAQITERATSSEYYTHTSDGSGYELNNCWGGSINDPPPRVQLPCYDDSAPPGFCQWNNTVGVTCTLVPSTTVVVDVVLLECSTTPQCVCATDLPYPVGVSCRRTLCYEPSDTVCAWVNSPMCPPPDGCSDCTAFGNYASGSPEGLSQPFPVTLYAGEWCCPNVWTNSLHAEFAACGGRGTCGADGQCVCDSGTGGMYCCPQPSGWLSACGVHGTCSSDGTCSCDVNWSGATCEVDGRCGGGCGNGGVCFDAIQLRYYSTQLHLELDYTGVVPYTLGFSVTPGNEYIASLNIGDGSSNDIPFVVTSDSVTNAALHNALLIRALFMGMDVTDGGFHSKYYIDCEETSVIFYSDLYLSILGLSGLELYSSVWLTGGEIDITSAANEVFRTFHPSVALDTAYISDVVAIINSEFSTKEEVAFALTALLVYEVLQNADGVASFPSSSAVTACQCNAALGSGTNCQNVCPVGENNLMCSGFTGGVRRGTCASNGICSCATNRFGAACEVNVVGTCVVSSVPGSALCSSHGVCSEVNSTYYGCVCSVGWTGTYCSISVCSLAATPMPSDLTIECDNQPGSTCGADGECTCVFAPTSTTIGNVPVLPVGDTCQINAIADCGAFFSTAPNWRSCSNHGTCLPFVCAGCNTSLPNPDDAVAYCECDNGFDGDTCQNSICGSPGCNDHETCNEATGICECLPKWSTPAGSCNSGDITCRCQNSMCGFGNVSSSGSFCECDPFYRVDSTGSCTIVQCPLIEMTDYGEVKCNVSNPICNSTQSNAQGSHSGQCCYDACVTSLGGTLCSLVAGQPTCACNPSVNYASESGGVCYSKCHGQPISSSGQCLCAGSFFLFPPFNPVNEFMTLASCTRMTCLNGATVQSSGQSCKCAAFFNPPLCATVTCPSTLITTQSPLACVALNCTIGSPFYSNCTACVHGRPTITNGAIVCDCTGSGYNGTFCSNPVGPFSSSSSSGLLPSSSSSSSIHGSSTTLRSSSSSAGITTTRSSSSSNVGSGTSSSGSESSSSSSSGLIGVTTHNSSTGVSNTTTTTTDETTTMWSSATTAGVIVGAVVGGAAAGVGAIGLVGFIAGRMGIGAAGFVVLP